MYEHGSFRQIEHKMKFAVDLRRAIRNDEKFRALTMFNQEKEKIRDRRKKIDSSDEKVNDNFLKWLSEEEDRITKAKEKMESSLQKVIKAEQEESKKAITATGEQSTPPTLLLGYAAMVFCRTMIEVGFDWLFFQVYEFDLFMPEKYLCVHPPCNNKVSCYVDRPKQKTFVLCFMFATSILTICIGVIEFCNIGLGKIITAFTNRHKNITNEYNLAVAEVYSQYVKKQPIIS